MENDWRLTNQIDYLYKKILTKKHFTSQNERWGHEHCEFCLELIDETTGPAYATEDNYYWICPKCFSDFNEKFKWIVETNI